MASRKWEAEQYAARRIAELARQRNESGGRAALAHLRHGVGHAPGELPQLWGEFLRGLPERMQSRTGVPTAEEWAIYTALTLYALHQQGKSACMHVENVNLGAAAAQLVGSPEEQDRVWRRLNLVAQADDIVELVYRLRQLITLLKAENIGLDYGKLAGDLVEYQFADSVNRVRLRWGQSFFHGTDTRKDNEEGDQNE